ncbi:sensor histidine kinase [Paenibacillus amylolyticus]|uniref:sensor histidine kinase n=1 Tax=Paenibacillus amylolyticus TaxID=1451 RepID=UPI000B875377|nr:histidine kinase [Paenibacillus amylolyticus]
MNIIPHGSAKRKIFNSIRFKLIAGLFVIIFPMIIFLIYNNLYSIKVVRNQVAQSNSNLVNLYMNLSDAILDDIDRYLYKVISEDSGLQSLASPDETNPDLYNMGTYLLFRQFIEDSVYYKGLDYFFAFSAVNEDLVFAPKPTGHAYTWNQPIREEIVHLLQSKDTQASLPRDKWFVTRIAGTDYLLKIIKSGNVYIGAGVNVSEVMGPLDLLNLGSKGKAVLVTDNNKPLQDEIFFNENKISLINKDTSSYLTGEGDKYLVTHKHSAKGNFRLVAVIPDETILEGLPYLQRVIFFITTGTGLILLAALFFIRKVILLPINRLVFAMRKAKKGLLEQRIERVPSSSEFELMDETFNSMVSEIQQLKINVYAEQLISQKAELKHLQLQINPHFFLNSLNIVYYLAQEKKYNLIQELSLSLVRYFRFMFRSQTDFVLLQDELDHTENYLKIQEFRFPGSLEYSISLQQGLEDCLIPPLMIQTFTENTIKHAINTDGTTQIHIVINSDHNDDGDRMIHIHIKDTGKGFSDDILHQLQQQLNLTNEDGEHIGIWNVRRRLLLLFGDKAHIEFSNSDGAVIDIMLPYCEKGDISDV